MKEQLQIMLTVDADLVGDRDFLRVEQAISQILTGKELVMRYDEKGVAETFTVTAVELMLKEGAK